MLAAGPREEKLGIKASSTCPVRFDDVRVPADALLEASLLSSH